MPPRERLKNLVNKAIPCFAKRAPGKFCISYSPGDFCRWIVHKTDDCALFSCMLAGFFCEMDGTPVAVSY